MDRARAINKAIPECGAIEEIPTRTIAKAWWNVEAPTRQIEKSMRTITVRASTRHMASGLLAPVVIHLQRRVTHEEYATEMRAAIIDGAQNILKIWKGNPKSMPDAFRHPRLGPIGLDQDHLFHILERRRQQLKEGLEGAQPASDVLIELAKTVVMGEPQEDPPTSGRTRSDIVLVHGEHMVILSPNRDGDGRTWVVSGYRMWESKKAALAAAKAHNQLKYEHREK